MNIIGIFNKRQLKDIDFNRWLLYSFIFMVVGLLLALLIAPEVTQCVVKYMFTLMRGSYLRNQQRKLPFVYNVYFWNTTNPEEIMQGGKPKLQELGPYVMHGIKSKINMVDNDDDDTVSYDIYNEFTYRPDLTLPLTGDEVLTLPHPFIVTGMVKTFSEMPEMIHFVKAGLNIIFDNPTSPFLTVRARQALYERIEINCDVHEFSAKAICAAAANEDTIEKVNGSQQLLGYSILFQLDKKKQGNYKVLRGLENVHDVGRIVGFNGEPELDIFEDEACNVINGTDELFFGPFMEENDIELAYEFQACQSLSYHFRELTNIKGHKTVRKVLKGLDSKLRPTCDCNEYLGCVPKGAVDLNQCFEAPIAGAMPHFLSSGPELQEMFEGLSPNPEKHYVGIDFDLLTGVAVRIARRFQVNFRVVPVKEIPIMENLPTVTYPIFWFEEIITSTHSEDKVIARVHFWDIFLRVIGWLLFSFGLIVTTIATIALLSKRVPITPVTKLENPEDIQRPSTGIDDENSRSVSQPETPDSISTVEQDDQNSNNNNNDFELYNRVRVSAKSEPNNVPEEEEDEGIDGR